MQKTMTHWDRSDMRKSAQKWTEITFSQKHWDKTDIRKRAYWDKNDIPNGRLLVQL